MPEFKFDPPMTLKGNVVVRSLDDAVRFMIAYRDGRQTTKQRRLLYHLEGADDATEQRDAAFAFRDWAEAENLLVKGGT